MFVCAVPVYTLLWKQSQSAFYVFSVYKLLVLVLGQKIPWKWQKHHMGCWLRFPTGKKYQLKTTTKKELQR